MKFARVFRGYAPKEVDAYLNTLKTKNDELLSAQRQRLNELADENYSLRQTLSQYQNKEKAISEALTQARCLAEKTQNDAEKYAETTVLRAKVFFAAWQTYAKTLVASLDDGEVAQLNAIVKKMECQIDSFDGLSVRDFAQNVVCAKCSEGDTADDCAKTGTAPETTPESHGTTGKRENPLEKVQKLLAQSDKSPTPVIELDELTNPTESLEELCRTLGIK